MKERVKVKIVVDIGDLSLQVKADSKTEIDEISGFVRAAYYMMRAQIEEVEKL